MLEAYISVGFEPETFWKLTPKLYWIYMSAARKRLVREKDLLAWHAWHTAYLPHQRKPVNLADMLSGNESFRVTKTWQEQYRNWALFCDYRGKKNVS